MKEKNLKRFRRALSQAAALTIFAGSVFGQETDVVLQLERSSNLHDWESVPAAGNILSEDGSIRLPDAGEDAGFFRLKIDVVTVEPAGMVVVEGGTLPAVSDLGALDVDTFQIGRYPVTWGEWKEVQSQASEYGYDITEGGEGCADNHPVHSVSWFDAIKWTNLKSEIEGLTPAYTLYGGSYRTGEDPWGIEWDTSANGYRLPTEEEWEFAARGGNESQGYEFSGSDEPDEVAWSNEESGGAACPIAGDGGTWPVGRKLPNEVGSYDMSGNVWEWCWDRLADQNAIIRGGSWNNGVNGCTVSNWSHRAPEGNYTIVGLRLVRDAD